jgi:hypothetical protein
MNYARNYNLVVFGLLLLAIAFAFFFAISPFSDSPITALATSNSSANITVNVSNTLSIRLTDSQINFGNCSINTSKLNIFDSSKENDSNDGCDNINCKGIYQANSDYFIIQNDGNVDANLTISTNETANNVFRLDDSSPSGNSMYAYKSPSSVSCSGVQQTEWKNMTSKNVFYPVCSVFSYNSSIYVYAKIFVNGSASMGGSATWTFQASS